MQKYRCLLCNFIMGSRVFEKHLNSQHNLTLEEYYIKFIDDKTYKCPNCSKKLNFIKLSKPYNKFCSTHCRSQYTLNSYNKSSVFQNKCLEGREKAKQFSIKKRQYKRLIAMINVRGYSSLSEDDKNLYEKFVEITKIHYDFNINDIFIENKLNFIKSRPANKFIKGRLSTYSKLISTDAYRPSLLYIIKTSSFIKIGVSLFHQNYCVTLKRILNSIKDLILKFKDESLLDFKIFKGYKKDTAGLECILLSEFRDPKYSEKSLNDEWINNTEIYEEIINFIKENTKLELINLCDYNEYELEQLKPYFSATNK